MFPRALVTIPRYSGNSLQDLFWKSCVELYVYIYIITEYIYIICIYIYVIIMYLLYISIYVHAWRPFITDVSSQTNSETAPGPYQTGPAMWDVEPGRLQDLEVESNDSYNLFYTSYKILKTISIRSIISIMTIPFSGYLADHPMERQPSLQQDLTGELTFLVHFGTNLIGVSCSYRCIFYSFIPETQILNPININPN